MFTPHAWQVTAFEKIDNALIDTKHNLVSVAASVGSGKTALAAYAFGKFIQNHKNEKTISMFVAPRINLCNQQDKEIKKMLLDMFGLTETDYKMWLVNCESKESYKNDLSNLYQDHNIFVICDESLWGSSDKNIPGLRYNMWVHRFNKWKKEGYKFGSIVYDEAHNFDNNLKKITDEDLSINL